MSLLSKLNPLSWVKEALVSDYVGGLLRHALTAVGVFLVNSAGAPESFARLLVSPEFVGGVLAIVTSLVASVSNKKV